MQEEVSMKNTKKQMLDAIAKMKKEMNERGKLELNPEKQKQEKE